MANIHELPERGGDGLTVRQRRVLEVIRNSVDRRGYPPSLREIGEAVGLTSPSSVAYQLSALERKGYLRKDPHRPRAIEVVSPDAGKTDRGYRSGDATGAWRRAICMGLAMSRPDPAMSDQRPPTFPWSAASPQVVRFSPKRPSKTFSPFPARSSAKGNSSSSRLLVTR